MLCKVWEKKCGPLKEHFWTKLPFMLDAVNKMDSTQIYNHIKGLEKKCSAQRTANAAAETAYL